MDPITVGFVIGAFLFGGVTGALLVGTLYRSGSTRG